MKRDRRPRMSPSIGYIGSGNKTSVFTRRSRIPFKKVKEIYGEELERLNFKKIKPNLFFKKLTEKEKLEIKERVKSQVIKERHKELIIWIIIFLIALIIFILAKYFIITE